MFDTASAPWRTVERAAAPYTERLERRVGKLDRALLRVWAAVSPRFSGRLAAARQVARRAEREQPAADGLSDVELKHAAADMRAPLLREGFTPELAARVFTLVRTAAQRTVGLSHFPVQLAGGYAMLKGALVEIGTGEGKTLVATLPAATAALAGMPVHVITVNDYLAGRDGEWMRAVYAALGLTTGIVAHGQSPAERRQAYAADITYCSNKELGFDYLRDTIAAGRDRQREKLVLRRMLNDGRDSTGGDGLVLRGLHFAIVDEADSVLVDEARTPLVIASVSDGNADAAQYAPALELARELKPGADYSVDAAERTAILTEQGRARVRELATALPVQWRSRRAREEIAQQALAALHLFERDTHYLVRDGAVEIIDEFTGRVLEGRAWERGLHQMIELKEGCKLTGRRTTLARITYQRLFRRYVTLCGMTGTAAEVAIELDTVYRLKTARIPPNRPSQRKQLGCRLYRTTELKWNAVAEAALAMRRAGRPLLIGTRSVAASEDVASVLQSRGIEHVVLNARQDADEAAIIARAGEAGRIIVATNMAGRGTDIRLSPEVSARGGLHVILTELHESQRIDRQLFGRCARQGDPGSHEAIVSLDDDIFRRYAAPLVRALALRFRTRTRPLPATAARLLQALAQRAAEAANSSVRRANLEADWDLDTALAFAGRAD
jgi:preprotein translocase subunit SecA